MKPHLQPIVTNARQGRPVSSRNRPRAGRVNRPAALILLALVAFWIVAAVILSCIP